MASPPPEPATGDEPLRISPSSISTFTSCSLSYVFSYVYRLPEPPSPAASKGTLVHRALEHLMERPAPERSREAARADLDQAREELATDPDFTGLELTPEEWEALHADAARLVDNYFLLEDPREVKPVRLEDPGGEERVGLELRLQVELADGLVLSGIIDRLEERPDGEWVVTDYKTGNAPREGFVQQRLNGVHLYSLMCEKSFGRRPARMQLLHLAGPERISTPVVDGPLRVLGIKTAALGETMRKVRSPADARPRAGRLCDWCSFKEFCPAFGGDPGRAEALAKELAEQRRAERGAAEAEDPAGPPRAATPG